MFLTIFLSFVMAAISLAAFRMTGRHSRSSGSQDEMQEVFTLQRTILEQMDCFATLSPLNTDKTKQCTGKPLVLRDRSGKPLYPTNASGGHSLVWKNPAGKLVPTWELRASCQDDVIVVEKKQVRNDGSRSFLSTFSALWPIKQNPGLCRSYFSDTSVCSGKYGIFAGGSREYPLCCRAVSDTGLGGALAACAKDEFVALGGAWCGSGNGEKSNLQLPLKSPDRCVLDAEALAYKHIGVGSARGITATMPSLLAKHTDVALPAIMDATATFPQVKSMKNEKDHGGFLLQNGHSSRNGSATVDSWVGACKYDDWQGGFETGVRAFCCRKKQ